MRWVLRIAVSAILLVALAKGARFTLGEPNTEGMLRLSWRTLGQRVQVCRDYTTEERATLRQHMQLARTCTTSLLPYRLTVQLDDNAPVNLDVVPPGARGDRPLYVKEDFLLSPGEHTVRIAFLPYLEDETSDSGKATSVGAVEAAKASHMQEALQEALAKAPRFHMDRTVRFTAGKIVLVDIKSDQNVFRLQGE